MESGDETLKEHLARAGDIHLKTIQYELIEVKGDWIRQKTLDEVSNARFYTVLADEVSDVSNTEQLRLVLGFVGHSGEIKEQLLSSCPAKMV